MSRPQNLKKKSHNLFRHYLVKLRTLWEGHKTWKKYPTCFIITQCCQNKVDIFVAFLENLNFTFKKNPPIFWMPIFQTLYGLLRISELYMKKECYFRIYFVPYCVAGWYYDKLIRDRCKIDHQYIVLHWFHSNKTLRTLCYVLPMRTLERVQPFFTSFEFWDFFLVFT